MSWIRRTFGIDGFDLMVHVGVTIAVMFIGGTIWSHNDAIVMLATVSGASLLLLSVRRHRGLKQLPPPTSGEASAAQVADLEAQSHMVDTLALRVQELEERLDFTERLLAQARDVERLPKG